MIIFYGGAVLQFEGFPAHDLLFESHSQAEGFRHLPGVDGDKKICGARPVTVSLGVVAVQYVAVEGAARQTRLDHCEAQNVRIVEGLQVDVVIGVHAEPVAAEKRIQSQNAVGLGDGFYNIGIVAVGFGLPDFNVIVD